MNIKQRTYYCVDYQDITKFIQEEYPDVPNIKNYDYLDDIDWQGENDSYMVKTIPDMDFTDDKEAAENFNNWLQTGKWGKWGGAAYYLLWKAVEEGKIPRGEYLIEVSW